MIVFLKNFEVVYPGHSKHGKLYDFIIEKGKFSEIGKKLKVPKKASVVLENGCLAPGFVDIGTTLSTPGFEHRESIQATLDSAANGGFTEIVTLPNTFPVIDNAASLKSLQTLTQKHPINVHVCGSITKQAEGNSLSEMHDLNSAGAVAFSDGNSSIEDEGSLYRALQYATSVDKLVINQPKASSLTADWQMNEGAVNITLGLPGQNPIIEKIAVDRDLSVCAYAKGKMLMHKISTAESVESISKVSSKQDVFASVSYLNLTHSDIELEQFDSNWKIDPPLRSVGQRKKLVKAIQKGKVDVICSDHKPIDIEGKNLEFSEAEFGALGLETVYSALSTYCGRIIERSIGKLPLCKAKTNFKFRSPRHY